MKFQYLAVILVFALALGAVSAVIAQEEPPAPPPAKEEPVKAEPAKDAPAKEEPPKEEAAKAPEAAPAETPTPAAAPEKAAVPAKAAAATPAAAPAPKALGASAMTFAPLADSYKKAYDDMQAWMVSIDAQASVVDGQVQKLQDKLKENESALTQAKLAGDSKKVKSLQTENKQITSDITKAQKNLSAARSDYMKQVTTRAKQYQAATDAALDQVKSAK